MAGRWKCRFRTESSDFDALIDAPSSTATGVLVVWPKDPSGNIILRTSIAKRQVISPTTRLHLKTRSPKCSCPTIIRHPGVSPFHFPYTDRSPPPRRRRRRCPRPLKPLPNTRDLILLPSILHIGILLRARVQIRRSPPLRRQLPLIPWPMENRRRLSVVG